VGSGGSGGYNSSNEEGGNICDNVNDKEGDDISTTAAAAIDKKAVVNI
jgi:hypothetical protein